MRASKTVIQKMPPSPTVIAEALWKMQELAIWHSLRWTREDSTHGHYQMVNTKIRLITFFVAKDGEALYSQQKQDQKLTAAQIMNSLLPNSDLNWMQWKWEIDLRD